MQKLLQFPSVFALGLCLLAGTASAQTNAAPATPVKKELVTKLLKVQQPGIEAMARNLAEQPAIQLMNQAGMILQARVPADKRDAVAKEIGNDIKAYTAEAVPLVRDRAVKLAPSTAGKLLEDRFTEEELRQILEILESPVYAKFNRISGELEKSLMEKLVSETRPTIEPKVKALEARISKRLQSAADTPAAGGSGKSAPKTTP